MDNRSLIRGYRWPSCSAILRRQASLLPAVTFCTQYGHEVLHNPTPALGFSTMPRAIAVSVRQALWRAFQQGCSVATLALQFRLPRRTVYHLLRQARLGGVERLSPTYHVPPRGPRAAAEVVLQAHA